MNFCKIVAKFISGKNEPELKAQHLCKHWIAVFVQTESIWFWHYEDFWGQEQNEIASISKMRQHRPLCLNNFGLHSNSLFHCFFPQKVVNFFQQYSLIVRFVAYHYYITDYWPQYSNYPNYRLRITKKFLNRDLFLII